MKKVFFAFVLMSLFLPFSSVKAESIKERLRGRILLQVEKAGEAWYVNPENSERYFMGRPADAFVVMRSLGLGISNSDIEKIGLSGEISNNKKLAKRLAGKILLQVEKNGEAWYVNPVDYKRYFLGRPADAFALMQSKGLGISNGDIEEMLVSEESLFAGHRPKVELFVMSLCPFGLQMQKGITPVARALGNKIDFEIKFVDYAMHGWPEISENVSQYCIQKTDKSKYLDYLDCFAEKGDALSCFDGLDMSSSTLNNCANKIDKKYSVIANYKNQNSWKGGRFPSFNINKIDTDKYQVAGSPTLVVDGKKINTSRDSASLLWEICSYFDEKPSECLEALSSEQPSPGFGYTNSSGSGSCG